MARKLICLVALISLVSLSQAAPILAETYTLPGGSGIDVTWTEIHGVDQYYNTHPGMADGEFHGGYPSFENYTDWKIAKLSNPVAGEVIGETDERITYRITYNNLLPGGGVAGGDDPTRFVVQMQGLPSISSSDFVFIATAEYSKVPEFGHWKLWWETIYGYGHNTDNTFFTIAGNLIETQGDSNHYGYIENFQLNYPASPVPLPGAVWLLGTGLFRLACEGWRRRNRV